MEVFTADMVKLMVLNLPNFIGLVIAIFLQREFNMQLVAELRRCMDKKATEEESTPK